MAPFIGGLICQGLKKCSRSAPRILNRGAVTTSSPTPSNFTLRSPFSDLEMPSCTLSEYVWKDVNSWPDKVAVECGVTQKKFTYQQLRSMSSRLGSSLLEMGFSNGQVISLVIPNMPEYIPALLGPMEIGLTVNPINPIYTPDEISKQLKASNSSCVICHPDILPNIQLAVAKLGHSIPIISIHDFDGKTRVLPPGIIPFSHLVRKEVSYVTKDISVDLSTSCLLPFSSGTTGLPKGVCLAHNNVTANLTQCSHPDMTRLRTTSGGDQDVVPAVLPFFHIYGLIVILLQTLSKGAKLVTLPKFEPEKFLKILEANKEIMLYLVPPMILFLGSHPLVSEKHLEHIRVAISGAAPCSPSDIERVMKRKKITILQAYGLTESSPLLTYPEMTTTDTSTVGVPICNTLAKVVSNNEAQPAGKMGELCFKGPQIMKGYLNQPEMTAEVIDEDGWLHTGDTGYYDEKGYLYVADRQKELIKVKGFQVPPAELEAVLREHPEVLDAGVVGVACDMKGEQPLAFVVPKSSARHSFDIENLQKFVNSRVATYKQISKFVTINEIPKSASGKILRKELKQLANTKYQNTTELT